MEERAASPAPIAPNPLARRARRRDSFMEGRAASPPPIAPNPLARRARRRDSFMEGRAAGPPPIAPNPLARRARRRDSFMEGRAASPAPIAPNPLARRARRRDSFMEGRAAGPPPMTRKPPDPLRAQRAAERAGFEPAVRFRTHDFQSCTFDHSVTSPAPVRLPSRRAISPKREATRRVPDILTRSDDPIAEVPGTPDERLGAERAGFEPAEPLQVHLISNQAPSTTRSPLRRGTWQNPLSTVKSRRMPGFRSSRPARPSSPSSFR